MSQIEFNIEKDIQEKVIELLKRDDIRFEVMLGFAKTRDGVEPMIVVSEDLKEHPEFAADFYTFADKYFNFKKIKKESKTGA